MVTVKCVSVCGQNPAFQLISPPCFDCGPGTPDPQPPEFNVPPAEEALTPSGNLLIGTGISGEYASTVSDTLLQLFLVPIVAGSFVIGPSVDGVYTQELEAGQEISVAFGATSLTGRRITTDYDVVLSVTVDGNTAELALVDAPTASGFAWTDDAAYNIVDSAGNPQRTVVQNASRVRFLVDGGLLPVGSEDVPVQEWKLTATNKHVSEVIEVTATVNTSV